MAKWMPTTVTLAQHLRTHKKAVERIPQIMMLALISILISSGAQAQAGNTSRTLGFLPDSPSAKEGGLREQFENRPERETLGEVPPTLTMVTIASAKRPSTFDRKFVILQLFQFAATVADIETTRYGLNHGAQERSPLAGRHPSTTSLYAISVPLDVALGMWSYRLKKHEQHSRNWQIPPTICGAEHGAAAIYNLLSRN